MAVHYFIRYTDFMRLLEPLDRVVIYLDHQDTNHTHDHDADIHADNHPRFFGSRLADPAQMAVEQGSLMRAVRSIDTKIFQFALRDHHHISRDENNGQEPSQQNTQGHKNTKSLHRRDRGKGQRGKSGGRGQGCEKHGFKQMPHNLDQGFLFVFTLLIGIKNSDKI